MKIWAGYKSPNKIKIKMPKYDHAMIRMVKTFWGAYYNSSGKYWVIPFSRPNMIKLKALNEIRFGKKLIKKSKGLLKKSVSSIKSYKKLKVKHCKLYGFRKKLRKFQQEGLNFLESRNGNALLADEMGLGKTIQALAYLAYHPELRPAIVITPASVKYNWSREVEECMSEDVTVVSGSPKKGATYYLHGIVVINYDILDKWKKVLKKPKVVIFDECHYIKNSKSGRTVASKFIAKKSAHKILLSGTPIINRPIEFYEALKIIDKKLFPSYWEFSQRFCSIKFNGFGWDRGGEANMNKFHKILTSTVMLRRLKKDVLKELPEKVRSVIPVEITNKTEYLKAQKDIKHWLLDNGMSVDNTQATNKIEKLKQISLKGKMKQCFQWIDDFLFTGEKLVVFCIHHKTVDMLKEKYKKQCVVIDGRTAVKKRVPLIKKFATKDKIRLIVANLEAGGTGLDGMQGLCSNTVHIELDWVPHDQAEDRVHRMGQKDSVTAWYLIANNTIENDIIKLQDRKRKVMSQILDGKKVKDFELLGELLKSIVK